VRQIVSYRNAIHGRTSTLHCSRLHANPSYKRITHQAIDSAATSLHRSDGDFYSQPADCTRYVCVQRGGAAGRWVSLSLVLAEALRQFQSSSLVLCF